MTWIDSFTGIDKDTPIEIEDIIRHLKGEIIVFTDSTKQGEINRVEYHNRVMQEACKLLEKQIPAKPIHDTTTTFSGSKKRHIYFCPTCNTTNCLAYDEYCPDCGQKIDWGDVY